MGARPLLRKRYVARGSLYLGVNGVGTDINPLAVYLANAKVLALSVPAESLELASKQALAAVGRQDAQTRGSTGCPP